MGSESRDHESPLQTPRLDASPQLPFRERVLQRLLPGRFREIETESVCQRCRQLDIPRLLRRWKNKDASASDRRTYSDTATQRLIFDEGEHEVVADTCTACRDLCNKFIPDSDANHYYGNNTQGRSEEDGVLIYPAKVIPAVDPALSWFTMKHRRSLGGVEPYEMSVSMWMTRGDDWQSADDDSSSLGSSDAGPVQIQFGRLESSPNDGRGYGLRAVGLRPDYALISSWLARCSAEHSECQVIFSPSLIKIRLINVDSRLIVPYPGTQQRPTEYIALSYVWGDVAQPPCDRRVRLGRLPQTIEDSLEVVRCLGKKYLWVDSICIDQTNQEEKAEQIAIMCEIYSGAFATIVAMQGRSADSGLPRVGSVSGVPQLSIEFSRGNRMVECFPPLDGRVGESRWARRGWTYQEGLLSRRCILFDAAEVYFCCAVADCSESCPNAGSLFTVPREIRDPLAPHELHHSVETAYEEVVSTYGFRELTREEDAINAVSGVLSYLQTHDFYKTGFFQGLPRRDLQRALLWHRKNEEHGAIKSELFGRVGDWSGRREAVGFPSWTWAGKPPGSFKLYEWWSLYEVVPRRRPTSHAGAPDDSDRASGDMEDTPVEYFTPAFQASTAQGDQISNTRSQVTAITVHKWRGRTSEVVLRPAVTNNSLVFLERMCDDLLTCTPVQPIQGARTSSSGGQLASTVLHVKGILLCLPYHVVPWSGAFATIFTSLPTFELSGFDRRQFPVGSFAEKWRPDAPYRRFPKVGEPSQELDLLFLHALFEQRTTKGQNGPDADPNPGVSFYFLIIQWENGIAFRGGVVELWVAVQCLREFWWTARPRYASFALG